MLNQAPTSLALLNHLGIVLMDALETDAWGDPVEVVHAFAPAALVDQVSEFASVHYPSLRMRVFEGSAPPF